MIQLNKMEKKTIQCKIYKKENHRKLKNQFLLIIKKTIKESVDGNSIYYLEVHIIILVQFFIKEILV